MPHSKRKHIYVLEDDFYIRTALCELLADEGHLVIGMADGDEALAQMAEHPPCLILLDWMMPKVSGRDVLAQLRADVRFAAVPVLVLSAQSPSPADLAGAVAFLPKPIHVGALLDHIRTYCPAAAPLKRPTNSN